LWLDSVPLGYIQVNELRITRYNTCKLEDYCINTETLRILRTNTIQTMSVFKPLNHLALEKLRLAYPVHIYMLSYASMVPLYVATWPNHIADDRGELETYTIYNSNYQGKHLLRVHLRRTKACSLKQVDMQRRIPTWSKPLRSFTRGLQKTQRSPIRGQHGFRYLHFLNNHHIACQTGKIRTYRRLLDSGILFGLAWKTKETRMVTDLRSTLTQLRRSYEAHKQYVSCILVSTLRQTSKTKARHDASSGNMFLALHFSITPLS
jgi:hypothetical protein